MSGPLPAAVTVAESGQVGLLIQPCMEERHQVINHGVILDDVPGAVAGVHHAMLGIARMHNFALAG
ncbi:hypothetical protein [Streptomyces sp. NPDC054849]